MKTYLVTGGAGFIGSNFVHHLLSKYNDLRIVNVDALTYAGNLENLQDIEDDPRHIFVHDNICDECAMAKLFECYQPEYVVNFAAESHVDRSIEMPDIFARTNVMGTVVLLNQANAIWMHREQRKFKRFLQVSTDEVYGSLSLDEPNVFFHEFTPLAPHSPYSASKAAADMFVQAYGDTYGLPINITRCSNNYGPYQFPEKLIPLIIDNATHHKKLPLYGDGRNVRDWLYVRDHCEAIDLVLCDGTPGEVYNIGGHNEKSNMEIVTAIIELCSKTLQDPAISETLITYVEDRKGHDRRYGIDPHKIKADLGWCPTTSFSEGIEKTILWYLDHPEWIERVTSGEYREHHQRVYSAKGVI